MHYCPNPQSFYSPTKPWGDPNLIATGYFDGETEGLLRCGFCDQTFQFQLLDWDENQDQRIFSLARISLSAYEEAVKELTSIYGPQSQPYWVPNNPALTDAAREAVSAKLATILLDASKPEAVLLTENIEREIMALVVVQPGEPLDGGDWWLRLRPRGRER